MSKSVWAWAAFLKRNVKLFAVCLAGFVFLWNGLDLWEWLCALFGWESQGYTSGEQRKYRFFASGFVVVFMLGLLLDVFNTRYYRKYPSKRCDKKESDYR
ncbi:hypothetical protein [Halomonas sp. A29]|uniref:hypothetical protein n=1 Tax=Halomonas sp. A29 TaxID=3102786 RepID=UPI00398AE54B